MLTGGKLCSSYSAVLLLRVQFTNQVGSVPLDGALGAFILQSTESADSEVPDWFPKIIGDDSHSILSIGVILVVFMLIGWCVSKWRKPQLKTIYDLEKGRYVISRVNRY